MICVPLQEGFKYFLPAYYPRSPHEGVKAWEFCWQRSFNLNDYTGVWFCNQIRNTTRYLPFCPGSGLLSLSIMLWSAYVDSVMKFQHSGQIWTTFQWTYSTLTVNWHLKEATHWKPFCFSKSLRDRYTTCRITLWSKTVTAMGVTESKVACWLVNVPMCKCVEWTDSSNSLKLERILEIS